MSDGDQLLALLARVRRRLRLQVLADGSVRGASLGLLLTALALLGRSLAGGGGPLLGVRQTGLVLTLAALFGVVMGGLWRLARRRVVLPHAARRVDQALAGRGGAVRNGDRVLVALGLLDRAQDPFAAAAIGDALRSSAPVAARQVAPWRRPGGLPALGLALGVALTSLWAPRPTTAAGTRSVAAGAALPAAAGEVKAELAELRRMARELADPELETLVDRLALVLEELPGAGAWPGDLRALEQALAAIEARARAEAAAGATLADALAAVSAALARDPATHALAERLAAKDGPGTEQAMKALGRAAASAAQAERQRLAETLARGAQAAGRRGGAAGDEPQDEGERRRRLSGVDQAQARDAKAGGQDAPGGREGDSADRALRRLERDLDEAADRCREDPAACAESLQQQAPSVAGPAQRAGAAGAHERLARAAQRVRTGLPGRPESGGQGRPAEGSNSSYERAARGQGGEEASGQAQDGQGDGQGERRAGGAAAGEGTGRGSSDDVIGAGEAGATERMRGRKVETSIGEGPGPSRAEAIETGARYGFARPGYQRVYRDYSSAVENSLELGAVPPARRTVVRRYFELIRPR